MFGKKFWNRLANADVLVGFNIDIECIPFWFRSETFVIVSSDSPCKKTNQSSGKAVIVVKFHELPLLMWWQWKIKIRIKRVCSILKNVIVKYISDALYPARDSPNICNNNYSISQEICTRLLLCCALLWLYIDWFSHIHQAYFTGTVAI